MAPAELGDPTAAAAPEVGTTAQPAAAAARRRTRVTVAALVGAVVVAAGFVAYAVNVSRSVPASQWANLVVYQSPARAPSFDLANLAGKGRVTSALLGKGPAVVNWFRSTCVACQAELGTFAAVADREGAHVSFVGIDINDVSPSAALNMVRKARVDYPVGEAPGLGSINLATSFGVGDLPATVFVSPQRKILGEVLGKVSTSELQALLGNLVAGRALNA